jgi:hypothetical protein
MPLEFARLPHVFPALALLAACGGAPETKPTTAAKPVPTNAEPDKAPAKVEAKAEVKAPSQGETKAQAPEAPKSEAPKEKFAWPNVEFENPSEPKTSTLGPKTLVTEPCKLDTSAPDMRHEWFDKVIPDLAIGPDGAIYALDHEHKVRRYLPQPGPACVLALDPAFGTNGVLSLPDPPESITILADGTLAGIGPKTMFHKAGKTDVLDCRVTSLYADGKTGIHAGFDTIEKINLRAECKSGEVTYTGWEGLKRPSFLFVREFGSDLLAAATVDATHYVAVHDGSGKMRFKFGQNRDQDKNAQKEDRICWTRDADACGAGICVLDSNCRNLAAWDAKRGKFVGSVDLHELLGLFSPWPSALAVRKDIAYMAIAHKEKDNPSIYLGVIFRIKGLD